MTAWLRCVNRLNGEADYRLNPANVIYTERDSDGWWHACDVAGRMHLIVSEDEAKVRALVDGAPTSVIKLIEVDPK